MKIVGVQFRTFQLNAFNCSEICETFVLLWSSILWSGSFHVPIILGKKPIEFRVRFEISVNRKKDFRRCRRKFPDFQLLTRSRKKHSNSVSPQFCACPKPNIEISEAKRGNEFNEPILPLLNPSSDLITEQFDNINMPTHNVQMAREDIFQLAKGTKWKIYWAMD